ncbi:MAG TPA: adenylate/guanylate cyclase domain-containing protein [Myxococcota bacterium]|jgi:adenylate cyclase|nr:adenylate/guanylate cyclase domain-containing protein [Myxococcota bacterium]
MFQRLRSRLVLKIGLATLALVGAGFSALTVVNAVAQARLFDTEHRRSTSMLSGAITVGVRNAMLAGDGRSVEGLMHGLRASLPPGQEVHVFDRRGAEVFGEPAPPPAPDTLPAPLRSALAAAASAPAASAPASGGVRWVPIANEERCQDCHEAAPLRGVLALGPRPTGDSVPSEDAVDLETRLVRLAFEQIMTARRSDDLTPFFKELDAATGGRVQAGIVDVSGELKFGVLPRAGSPADDLDVPDELLYAMPKSSAAKAWSVPGMDLRLVPLPNEERCQECHEPETGPLRGGLWVGVRRDPGPDLVVPTIDRALRFIMLSGLGRLVVDYLEAARPWAHLDTLALYDGYGRTYHDTATTPAPPPAVKTALVGGGGSAFYDGRALDERFVTVEPLANDRACKRCHGSAHAIRGVVEVVTPTGATAMEARMQLQRGVWLGLGTLALVFGALFVATKRIVVDPVRHIGDVAESVGRGQLDRTVDVSSPDEIGRLSERINEMIRGLRERLQLSKFVSGGTLAAVAGGEEVLRGGMRRRLTVFFSDIRGFTAYSERVSPEKVVAMLNRYLHAQTDLVRRHGGDVDKYVGDELVAVFTETAAAVRCALDAVEAVAALDREDGEGIAIGVGVNCGDVVMGAIGHANRMDYTVIGDAVNVGARLCSKAEGGQVLVSAAARAATGTALDADVAFVELPPLPVKGKAEPLVVFAAARRPA